MVIQTESNLFGRTQTTSSTIYKLQNKFRISSEWSSSTAELDQVQSFITISRCLNLGTIEMCEFYNALPNLFGLTPME